MTHLFTVIIIASICSYGIVQNSDNDYPGHLVSNIENAKQFANKIDVPSKMLVINAFDVTKLEARKNKKKLLNDLDDSVIKWLADDFRNKGEESIIIPDLIRDTTDLDNSVLSLIKKNEAKYAIVITFLNAWFDLTDVEVERNFDNSKSKTASFDICSVIGYKLYDEQGLLKKSDPQIRSFFTSRPTAGSLLSFGPDIVGKRKYAIEIIHDNTTKLLCELKSSSNSL